MVKALIVCLFLLHPLGAQNPPFDFTFDQSQQRWVLNNGTITAVFQLSEDGIFGMEQAGLNAWPWHAPAQHVSSPIRLSIDGRILNADTHYTLIEQHTEITTRKGFRQVITLQDLDGLARITLHLAQ